MRISNLQTAAGAIIVALLLVFTGCNLGLTEGGPTAVDGEYDYQEIAKEDAEARAAQEGEPFQVTGVTAVGALGVAEEQTVKITFADGVVDSDALDAIRIYQLSDATEAYGAYVRGDTLSFSSNIYELASGGSEVFLTFDATGVQTNLLEVYIPSSVTAGSELKTLDQDGDGVGGETEDDYIEYVSVAGTPQTLATGVQRNPRGTFSAALYFVYDPNDPGSNEPYDSAAYHEANPPQELLVVYGTPANATEDDFDGAVSVSGKFLLQRLSDDGWVDVSTSAAEHADHPNVDVVTVNDDFTAETPYRWFLADPWLSDAWNGYPLFYTSGGTDQHAQRFSDRWMLGDEFTHYTDGVSGVDFQIGDAWSGSSGYLDVEFTGLDAGNNEELVRSSVKKDLFTVYSEYVSRPLGVSLLVWQDDTTVRLVLESSQSNVPSDISVTIDPGIKTELDDVANPGERITTNAFEAPLDRTGRLGYELGDVGPAGGNIFYIDQDNEYGWQYLEAAPAATEWYGKPWGGYGTEVGGTEDGIGSGAANTQTILQAYGASEPFDGRGDYAARVADQLSVDNGGKTYDDWYMPSIDELELMYDNLDLEGVGGFTNGTYKSSTENGSAYSRSLYFWNGSTNNYDSKNNTNRYTRAVRSVY